MIDLYQKMVESRKKPEKKQVHIKYTNKSYHAKSGKMGKRTCRIFLSPTVQVECGIGIGDTVSVITDGSLFNIFKHQDGFRVSKVGANGTAMITIPEIPGVYLNHEPEEVTDYVVRTADQSIYNESTLIFSLKPIEVVVPDDRK